MRSLTYTNPLGQSLLLYLDPYLITTLDGIEMPTVDNQEQRAPYQDGTTYLDALFEPRTIVVTGAILKQDLPTIYTDRAAIQAILNPKNGPGVLTFVNNFGTYTTVCYCNSCLMPNKLATDPFQTWQFQFYCNDPYWYGATQNQINMALVTGGFTFPFFYPKTFGAYTGSTPTLAVNAGDSVTPVVLSITGPCLNPKVTNQTTGLFMKFNITLNTGDIIIANTKFGSKSVIRISGGVSTNQMSILDATSSFWQLAIGNNNILFSDDTNGSTEFCIMTWYNRYSGR